MKTLFKATAAIMLLTLIVVGGSYYWHYTTIYPSTDDAYLETNRVNIAAEVNGKLVEVNVKNNQHVNKGDVLIKIDPTHYQLAVQSAQAQLELTAQQLRAGADAVIAAQAKVKQAQAQYTLAQKTAKRILTLVKQGRASKAEGDDTQTKLDVTQAGLKEATSQLSSQQQQLGAPGDQNAKLRAARANLAIAKLNLTHTQVIAPHDGIVTNFSLRSGDMANPGQPLFSLIEGSQWWITANFKENNLYRIKPGQSATINVDMYPNHTFHGVVDSISAGTGSAFSIMPPENATGNWVKVTQRIPVKIFIKDLNTNYPLRIGASATVSIDTQHHEE